MKKTTRFLSIVLVFVMAALACCSCGKVTPEEKMMTAIENAQAAKKGDVTVKIGSNMVVGEVSMDIPMEIIMQYDFTDDTNPLLAMDMSFTMEGKGVSIKTYYKDGYRYLSTFAGNTKSPMQADEMRNESTAGKILDLAKVAVDTAEITENDDGSLSITMNVDGEQHSEAILATFDATIEDLLEGTDIKAYDSVINMEIDKDGKITKTKISFDISMVTEEGNVYLDYIIEIDYKTITDDFTVVFPDDLDTYVIPQTTPLDSVA